MKLKLRVKITGEGTFEPDERTFPKLTPGTAVDLCIDSEAIEDADFLARLKDEQELLFDVSDGIAVRLNSATEVPPSHTRLKGMPNPSKFAAIELKDKLRIRLRVGQDAVLPPQTVYIPDLGVTVSSLNQACVRLSERFETDRTTHTYSAFEVVYVRRGKAWIPIKELI